MQTQSPIITLATKPRAQKFHIDIDLGQWEQLADVFGFYREDFLHTLNQSLTESRLGKVKKIKRTLRELESIRG